MSAPFPNAVKGTTAGTPGTGAFTPNTNASGFLAWSTVYANWTGLVRYEDGSAWELSYGYWNATTITRPSSAFVASSTGSQLSLSSSATAALVIDGTEIQPHLGGTRWAFWNSIPGSTTISVAGLPAPTVTGTATTVALATTSYFAEQVRVQLASATTANGQAGLSVSANQAVYSPTAGRGGFDCTFRMGANQLPTGPRFFGGMTDTTLVASTAEPSALVGSYFVIAKDSTDTNFQFVTNNGTGGGTKTDTGIPWVANAWYEGSVWTPPGGGSIYATLFRLDDPSGSNMFYGTRTTDIPAVATPVAPQMIAGLNGTNTGTALNLHFGVLALRAGGG